MVIKRRANSQRLRSWLAEVGLEGRAKLARTGLSFQVIDQLVAGTYKRNPNGMTIRAVCEATGIPESELFPMTNVNAGGGDAA